MSIFRCIMLFLIKLYPSFFIFLSIIILSPVVLIRRDNFYYTWISLELSLFGFIPLFLGKYMERIVKYFIVQAGGTAMYLISVIRGSTLCIVVSLTLKIGLFPFFQWVPLVMSSARWIICFFITTIQKISPILLLYIHSHELILIIGLISVVLGGFIGVNQTYMRDLISYSSISHRGWITISTKIREYFFLRYIILYFTLSFILINIFKNNNIIHTTQTYDRRFNRSLILLTILGIPPFTIFFFKCWILMEIAIPQFQLIILLGAASAAFFYFTVAIVNLRKNFNSRNLLVLIALLGSNLILIWAQYVKLLTW